jgi:hypothetical protein
LTAAADAVPRFYLDPDGTVTQTGVGADVRTPEPLLYIHFFLGFNARPCIQIWTSSALTVRIHGPRGIDLVKHKRPARF